MPPWILATIAAITTALPIVLAAALFVGPVVIPLWLSTLDAAKLAKLRLALKGAYDVLGPIAASTPNTYDDGAVKVLVMTIAEVDKLKAAMIARAENELGKKLTGKKLVKAEFIAESIIGKQLRSVGALSGTPVAGSVILKAATLKP